jgi:hypothetical protein
MTGVDQVGMGINGTVTGMTFANVFSEDNISF